MPCKSTDFWITESFLPTEANYLKAVQSLKARFSREYILVEVYDKKLLKLIITVQTKGEIALTFLYDKLESDLGALEKLGISTD